MDKEKLERLELLEKAMKRLGKFGNKFVDYKGCPRGPRGELGDVPGGKHILLNEDPIVDVEGDTWIPVYAKDLYRYIDKHRWIPVTERLPEHCVTVLSYDGRDYRTVKTDSYDHCFECWLSDADDILERNTVTHWMHLPEPPTEDYQPIFADIDTLSVDFESELHDMFVKHGRWIEHSHLAVGGECSVCGWQFQWFENNEALYCPHCGAKMDAEES